MGGWNQVSCGPIRASFSSMCRSLCLPHSEDHGLDELWSDDNLQCVQTMYFSLPRGADVRLAMSKEPLGKVWIAAKAMDPDAARSTRLRMEAESESVSAVE